MKTRKELIKKFIEFFKKKRHKEILNASLIPQNDPTVLFTTAGMHSLVPYLLGQAHPLGRRLCNIQRCVRTGDIDEVGNTKNHTFFEMLGNWSLGDYFKKESIEFSFEFLTKVLNIPVERLATTVFAGDKDAPRDIESAKIWHSLGISKEKIAFLPKKDNWWGPAGLTGPCGPNTEIFYWKVNDIPFPKAFDPKNDKWVEIWNIVLMQYIKDNKGNYIKAKQKNVDTGMGVERTITILNGLEDDYLGDSFYPIIHKMEKLSGTKYGKNERQTRLMRIITDHIKASCFIIADGIIPSNVEQGYVLRKLIRRAVRYGRQLSLEAFTKEVAFPVFEICDDYKHLQKNKENVLQELVKEETKFMLTLEKGIKIFEKIANQILKENKNQISGEDAFLLYQSYGFPMEMTQELAKEKGINVDVDSFKKEEQKHRELSKTASEGKFKSGLADNSEVTTKLHTATHLLNKTLREVLKKSDLHQKGSNITPERLRFDFNFDRKLTDEELQKIEELVNKKIKENLPVRVEEMTVEDAKKYGAEGVFESKYQEKVKVYFIGKKGEEFSKEICAGPHVSKTSELGKFKIIKEEASSAGVRRIKAILKEKLEEQGEEV